MSISIEIRAVIETDDDQIAAELDDASYTAFMSLVTDVANVVRDDVNLPGPSWRVERVDTHGNVDRNSEDTPT